MKQILNQDNFYLLRFDKEEEVIQGIKNFCQQQDIKAGVFQAIGAASKVEIAWYNLGTKTYQNKEIEEDLEIASVTGNIAQMESDLIIHAHGSFSDSNFVTLSGHIKSIVVSATCEVHLQVLEGEMNRKFDEQTGLNLLS